jgi:hypothetical protein
MKPFSDHEKSRIQAALLQRFLTTERAYQDYLESFKDGNEEGYSRDVYTGAKPLLLYTYCSISSSFAWHCWERTKGKTWAELNSESIEFIESEYKKIDKWVRTSVIAYDLYRFLGHEVFAAFVANVVRIKSILDVTTEHTIDRAFTWTETFEGHDFWSRLNSTYIHEFKTSEAAAL